MPNIYKANGKRNRRMDQKMVKDNPYDPRWAYYYGLDTGGVENKMQEFLESVKQLEIVDGQLVPAGTTEEALRKATITSADTGTFAYIYGQLAQLQLANQQNVVAALPKRGYPRNGFRARSARFMDSATGTTEGGTLPTAVEGTYNEIDVGLKDLCEVTEESFRWEVIVNANDGITLDGVVKDFVNDFYYASNADLLGDVDTTANLNIESIDRYTEASTAQSGIGFTAGDEDIFGVDRSANTWFNSYINHNSDSDRALVPYLIDSLADNVYSRWTSFDNKVYVTGAAIGTQWGYMENMKHRISDMPAKFTYAAGVQPYVGQAGGFAITSYMQRPIIRDESVADSGRRMYLLDMDTVGIATGRPLQLVRGDNILYIGAVKMQQAIYWIAELWGELPSASGQLRDITAPA